MTHTMLYKHGGNHKIHNDNFDYIVVSDDEVEGELKKGWFKTTPEALAASNVRKKKASPIPNSAPSRDEVKQKADELGIEYKNNIPTKKLRKMVEDKIDELDKAAVS